jgi:hypothetical protein
LSPPTIRAVPFDKRQKFVADLRFATGKVYIISDMSVPDRDPFIADLKNLFGEAGWEAESDVYFNSRDSKRGIGVFTRDEVRGTKQRPVVMRALVAAGFPAFELDDITPKEARQHGPWGRGDYDVGIRIYDRY